ncbi:helix-turn-helix transcriptional regulator [Dyadobacter sp. LHD-138]|uniref:response regulator transcription factor n=1 Tax=Dyadobacter sp. LHD-138 TaxID=3071413 RepID=UPI0027DF04B9|nr:helix-turn-helix transcriptional regulator [Dyadobacter sp. LHD-138]MDQ6478978.1 helix-turn-helix transcriptional regulator [Dyadobacter sp. LHD-138]
MESLSPQTYHEYLRDLALNPQSSAFDYAQYLKEQTTVGSICHLTSSAVFLLDYSTKSYPYIDAHSRAIVGHSRHAFIEGGLEFMLHNYHKRDLTVYNRLIFPDRLHFLSSLVTDSSFQYRFTHNYRFKRTDGAYSNILQHCTLIPSQDGSGPVALLGAVLDITHCSGVGKVMHQIEKWDQDRGWIPVLTKSYYPDLEENKLLSKREIEILKWLQEGYTSREVADRLHISFHTVTTHRKNMLEKTNAQNTTELIRFATIKGIL